MDEKKCPRCEKTLPLESFGPNRSRKDGKQTACRPCMKTYRRQHYHENKAPYIARAKARKDEARQHIRKLKEDNPCSDCGQYYPYYVMDFDHTGVEEKIDGIANLAIAGMLQKALDEIKKCELVCSNCHRVRTWQRLQK